MTGEALIQAGESGRIKEAFRALRWFRAFVAVNPGLTTEQAHAQFLGSLLNERHPTQDRTLRGYNTVRGYHDHLVQYQMNVNDLDGAEARIRKARLRQGMKITGRAEGPRRKLGMTEPLAIRTTIAAFFRVPGFALDVVTAVYLVLATGCRPKHLNAIRETHLSSNARGEDVLRVRWDQRKTRGPMNGFVDYLLAHSGTPPTRGVAQRIETLGLTQGRTPLRLGAAGVNPGAGNAGFLNSVYRRAGVGLRNGTLRKRMSSLLLPLYSENDSDEFEALMDHTRATAIRCYRLPCDARELLLD